MAIHQDYAGTTPGAPRGNGSNTRGTADSPGTAAYGTSAGGINAATGGYENAEPGESGSTAPVRQTLSKAKDRLADTMIAAQDRSTEMVSRASGYVQRYPFSMLATALGVGVVIGWLLAANEIHRSSSWMPRRRFW